MDAHSHVRHRDLQKLHRGHAGSVTPTRAQGGHAQSDCAAWIRFDGRKADVIANVTNATGDGVSFVRGLDVTGGVVELVQFAHKKGGVAHIQVEVRVRRATVVNVDIDNQIIDP